MTQIREYNVAGIIEWRNVKGVIHREDGPAVEYPNGTKEWRIDGILHREDGPAIEYASGSKYWYNNGKRHRIDGPACIYSDGDKYWYINGVDISNEVIQWRKEMGITNDTLTKEESTLFILYFGNIS